jgi:AmmeMemoRadiSam system radical SAM enzyme
MTPESPSTRDASSTPAAPAGPLHGVDSYAALEHKRTDDGAMPGAWWSQTGRDDRIECWLCPRRCNLKAGDRGFCFVRENRDGQMVLSTYGKSTGFCIDPIEKKPLNHFLPGTSVLSFGTAGCNLGCKFCQNWDISKSREIERLSAQAEPEAIATAAERLGCHSVAFTYNDPVVWAEYAIDTAKACRAAGVRTVAVTAGYISPGAREEFFQVMDAANVDLKAFTEDFYHKITYSHLQPVLDTLVYLRRETNVWFEITNLVIPGANDSTDELQRMCDYLLEHIGDEVPLHFTAFHPDFRMRDSGPTPPENLIEAYDIAKRTGLKYVYVGNMHDIKRQSTYCPHCGQLLIERDWYQLGRYGLEGDRCRACQAQIPGRYLAAPGTWGAKRLPVRIEQFAR